MFDREPSTKRHGLDSRWIIPPGAGRHAAYRLSLSQTAHVKLVQAPATTRSTGRPNTPTTRPTGPDLPAEPPTGLELIQGRPRHSTVPSTCHRTRRSSVGPPPYLRQTAASRAFHVTPATITSKLSQLAPRAACRWAGCEPDPATPPNQRCLRLPEVTKEVVVVCGSSATGGEPGRRRLRLSTSLATAPCRSLQRSNANWCQRAEAVAMAATCQMRFGRLLGQRNVG